MVDYMQEYYHHAFIDLFDVWYKNKKKVYNFLPL